MPHRFINLIKCMLNLANLWRLNMSFSIIIPAYNAEKYIARSIDSILNQTYNDFEIIVIDDGSQDDTYKIATSYNDKRINVIKQINSGVSVARNTGICSATKEFICFLDADDEYHPSHLEHLRYLINSNLTKGFFSTRFGLYSRNDSSSIQISNATGRVRYIEDVVSESLNNPEIVWTGCVCIRRDLFALYGMFEPNIKLGEDTDMWRRLYVHTGLVSSDTVTVKRNRDGSEATKLYQRRFEADPLKRLPSFMEDSRINDNIKASLIIENEYLKLQVVRSYLFSGNKMEAKLRIGQIDKSKIPKKRLYITYFCFFIPSKIIRAIIIFKNREIYEGGV